jgi:hypothetical protein
MPGVKTTKPVTFMAKKSPADLLKEGQELQAKAKQLIKDAQLKLKGEARKAHTKRLIILGAWIEANDPAYQAKIVKQLTRPQDIDAFKDWQPATPTPSVAKQASLV